MPDTTSACLAEPPTDGPWGDCWCTLPTGHTGEHHCEPCTARNHAPGWSDAPDWADVREAARNAGWTLKHRGAGPLHHSWEYQPAEGDSSVDVQFMFGQAETWSFRLDGKHYAVLIDPTPAEVLTAARLVGLGGGE